MGADNSGFRAQMAENGEWAGERSWPNCSHIAPAGESIRIFYLAGGVDALGPGYALLAA